MKLWEALEKGSGYAGKEFKHPHGYSLVCHGDVKFYYQGAAYGHLIVPNDGWYEVKQPVPWQEAIQAWADGKAVCVENKAGGRVYRHGGEGQNMDLLQSEITNGVWYLEE